MNVHAGLAALGLAFAVACRCASDASAQGTPQPAAGTPLEEPVPAPSVVIDGTPVVFDQPPVEEAGRIYVPLRGVFERLGASVVFANGRINATSGSHTIALHVGQPTATVDGTSVVLDSPPIVVGGRVLVPLRFVANALAASVKFDDRTQTAYINHAPTIAPPPPPAPVITPAPAVPSAPVESPRAAPQNGVVLRVVREEPSRGSTIARLRPEVSASFAEPVDPNGLHVSIDGRDVTAEAFLSDRSFVYEPSFDLPTGSHEVEIEGRTPAPAHEPFEARWAFATGAPTTRNYLAGVEPPNGITVSSPLIVSGITRPRSQVRAIATSSESVAHFSELAGETLTTDTVADARGTFELRLEPVDTGSGFFDVRLSSTAPDGGTAVKTLRLKL
jgi:hypothetical protein